MPQKTRMPPREMRPTPCAPTGTGRHKWRPYGQRRWQPDTFARNAAATHNRPHKKRRGATCDARMTDAFARDDRKKHGGRRAKCNRHLVPPRAPGVINGAPTGNADGRLTGNPKRLTENSGRLTVFPVSRLVSLRRAPGSLRAVRGRRTGRRDIPSAGECRFFRPPERPEAERKP